MQSLTGERGQRFETLNARLLTLDPEAVLARGYSIVTRSRDGKVVVRPGQARLDEQVKIQLSEGRLRAVVVRDEEDFLN